MFCLNVIIFFADIDNTYPFDVDTDFSWVTSIELPTFVFCQMIYLFNFCEINRVPYFLNKAIMDFI